MKQFMLVSDRYNIAWSDVAQGYMVEDNKAEDLLEVFDTLDEALVYCSAHCCHWVVEPNPYH